MSIKKLSPGEVLYFYPEELPILVVMVGDDGFRYIEPMNPQFDDNGNVLTTYLSYDEIGEWTTSLGSINNILDSLMGKMS